MGSLSKSYQAIVLYIENWLHGLVVIWQPIKGDLPVYRHSPMELPRCY